MVELLGCGPTELKSVIPANSEIVSTYADGKPKAIKVYTETNGAKEWTGEIQFHKNGTKSIEGAIKNGLHEGEWISWYDDGSLWSKGSFKNGIRDGRGIVYYRNGNIQIEGFYEKGERTGLWKSFDDEGNLISETDYSRGE
jgi:antitoxin component YwqK of YwqJK toxin-antitoxin module